ncbi:Os12g0434050 [Oryza sativa Japonica Group]|uniref:Os12g0434050 protein n=1 Tax=Oryza sativa subsp. japonica TaxID=39947 RepID=A0A0P0Y9Q0_ORYSJ|nr:Os12g0434050 [Oryza sativa Japonica Group]
MAAQGRVSLGDSSLGDHIDDWHRGAAGAQIWRRRASVERIHRRPATPFLVKSMLPRSPTSERPPAGGSLRTTTEARECRVAASGHFQYSFELLC